MSWSQTRRPTLSPRPVVELISYHSLRPWRREVPDTTQEQVHPLPYHSVRSEGFEPPLLAEPPSEDGVSASSTTSACLTWARQDLNLHALRHLSLSQACLPNSTTSPCGASDGT
jgi:hypothetical protein